MTKTELLAQNRAAKEIDGIKLFTVKTFDFDIIRKARRCKKEVGNNGGKKKSVLNLFVSFDIETTRLPESEQSIMYVWQMGIGFDACIIGRTWASFKHCIEEIHTRIPEKTMLKIWVHNLAYEFSFFKGIYYFEPEDVFILDGRRVAKCCMMGNIEFCCSYIQSNMSLQMLTSKYGVEHCKLSGSDFDYNKKRFPWSELSDEELSYCIHDVVGLNEAMKARMESYGDTLYTIPMTSTGYVRRDVKRAMHNFPHDLLQKQLPDFELYEKLELAFRGGNTHANRHITGQIIENIVSFDIQSSYPFQMVCKMFPVGVWTECMETSEKWYEFLHEQGQAILLEVNLYKLRLSKSWWGNPYIAKHKCIELSCGVFDNGRVLNAEYVKLILTDIDFEIIKEQYSYSDIDYCFMAYSKYGYLPEEIRDNVRKYFMDKTELKGIDEKKNEYDKAKAMLNSIYGMMAQRPVKQSIDFLINEEFQFNLQSEDRQKLYAAATKNAFTSYAWGVWVTAHARNDLFEGEKICGKKFVYADTDCCKFFSDKTTIKKFEARNREIEKIAKEQNAYAVDANGNTQHMGVWDNDGVYEKFITLGAKKYAVENKGEIKITIAGVVKSIGAKELGKLENFKEGFTFRDAGGLEAVYNDHIAELVEIDGHEFFLTDNVCLKQSTYTLGVTDEYKLIFSQSQLERY